MKRLTQGGANATPWLRLPILHIAPQFTLHMPFIHMQTPLKWLPSHSKSFSLHNRAAQCATHAAKQP